MEHGPSEPSGSGEAPAKVKDPICGMMVTPGAAKGGSHDHAGVTYWFCNPKCREKFAADPQKWLAPAEKPVGEISPSPRSGEAAKLERGPGGKF